MIAIPNIDKPKNITRCSYKINPEECKCIYTDKVFEETLALIMDHPCDDCPLIDIVTCGECVYFHYDKPYIIQGIPVFGHEVCDFWGDGCKTNPNGFCSYGERRSDE